MPSLIQKRRKPRNSCHRGLPETTTQAQKWENGRTPPGFFIERRKQYATTARHHSPIFADNTNVRSPSLDVRQSSQPISSTGRGSYIVPIIAWYCLRISPRHQYNKHREI